MRAILRVALDADLPDDQKGLRDRTKHEKIDVAGEGATWDEAIAAAETQIPPNSIVLYSKRAD